MSHAELWEEASRVSREYLPDSAEPVPPAVPPLLQRAAHHADKWVQMTNVMMVYDRLLLKCSV